MIKINLLQQSGSSRAAGATSVSAPGGGAFLVAGILVATFVVIIGFGAVRFMTWTNDRAVTAQVRGEASRLEREIQRKEEQFEDLQEMERVLRGQVALLETLDPEDRMFWAEKLNLLPMYVPDGVFLTQVRVTESSREVETAESRRRQEEWRRRPSRSRGPQPAQQYQTVITQQMVLEGVSYVSEGSSDDRLELITTFLRDLQTRDVTSPSTGETVRFFQGFRDLNYSNIEGVTIAGRECSRFAFTLRARSIGGG